jgi:tetrahydromethanopterin S-methyltransferase subunit A
MFKADKKGFFVVDVDFRKKRIVLSFHDYGRKLKMRFSSDSAERLWGRALGGNLVSDLSHAAYLGLELGRAEFALKNGLKYRQDEGVSLHRRLR